MAGPTFGGLADVVAAPFGAARALANAGWWLVLLLLLVVPGSDAPGGTLNFQCGPAPHTIALTSSKFLSDQVNRPGFRGGCLV